MLEDALAFILCVLQDTVSFYRHVPDNVTDVSK